MVLCKLLPLKEGAEILSRKQPLLPLVKTACSICVGLALLPLPTHTLVLQHLTVGHRSVLLSATGWTEQSPPSLLPPEGSLPLVSEWTTTALEQLLSVLLILLPTLLTTAKQKKIAYIARMVSNVRDR